MRSRLTLAAITLLLAVYSAVTTTRAQSSSPASAKKPNILVIFGDDIGQTNISAYSFGVMGYKTPNIDRIAKEGMKFTDYYAEQSCTAGRSTHIAHRSFKGWNSGRDRRTSSSRRNHRASAQVNGLCDGAIRQKPSRRS